MSGPIIDRVNKLGTISCVIDAFPRKVEISPSQPKHQPPIETNWLKSLKHHYHDWILRYL